MRNKLKDIVATEDISIKEAMRLIDLNGLRVAYIVDKNNKLIGVVSDSEIRKAILKGKDIKSFVVDILNPKPIVMNESELGNSTLAKRKTNQLLERMPDSRFILIVDKQGRPKKLVSCAEISNKKPCDIESSLAKGQKILVVGGAGYLGSVLIRKLLAKGFRVKVMDILMFGRCSIEELMSNDNFELVEEDMRNISSLAKALSDVTAVINLAAIVGDPACKNRPETAIETNYLANKALADACKYHQINRFVYASTCSVYGQMKSDEELTENSPLNPVSLYARSKIQSEEGLLSLEDDNFSPTIMRMSTLYGLSPRMRFDLVVNTMTKTALFDNKISVHGGGKQWRPLLNVEDATESYIRCLEAPLANIKGQVFNVGSSKQNYQIIDIAKAVKHCIPKAELAVEGENRDQRNYLVSFDKIEERLDFRAKNGLEGSIRKIIKAINNGELKNVNDPKYYNVENNQ